LDATAGDRQVTYFLAVMAAGMLGTGFVLQQRAAQRAPQGSFLRLRLLVVLLRDRGWLAGLLTMIGGQLLSGWVLGHLVLSVAEPLLATNLLFALLLAWPMSGQRLTKSEVAGALILVAGVAALSLARSLPSAQATVGSRANWPLAALGVAAASYAFAATARRRTGNLRATLTGASAGVVAGLQDALTRRVVQTLTGQHLASLLATWPGYVLIVVGALSIWLTQSAFSAGPLHASLPAITAGEPVTGIMLGIVIFGDRLGTSPGLIALQVAGMAALVGGVILVARGPALAMARREPGAEPGARPQPGGPAAPGSTPQKHQHDADALNRR
jgi:drug/metabolite transporter (DMT)-like permease